MGFLQSFGSTPLYLLIFSPPPFPPFLYSSKAWTIWSAMVVMSLLLRDYTFPFSLAGIPLHLRGTELPCPHRQYETFNPSPALLSIPGLFFLFFSLRYLSGMFFLLSIFSVIISLLCSGPWSRTPHSLCLFCGHLSLTEQNSSPFFYSIFCVQVYGLTSFQSSMNIPPAWDLPQIRPQEFPWISSLAFSTTLSSLSIATTGRLRLTSQHGTKPLVNFPFWNALFALKLNRITLFYPVQANF